MTSAYPDWLCRLPGAALVHWRHGWTTSAGPDFSSPAASAEHAVAVQELVTAAGLRGGAWANQIHGGDVVRAEGSGFQGDADAVWTSEAGVGVIGRSADCPLILVSGKSDAGHGLWGFAHASWRSTVAGITSGLLREMVRAGMRTDRAQAVICPSAGPCCYEVGPEVREEAVARLGHGAADYFPMLGKRPAFDLWRANSAQIEAGGVPARHITVTGICTICGGTDFPSHRRQQSRAGRFAAISGGDD